MTDESVPSPVESEVKADAPPAPTPQPKERDKTQERIDELTRKNARLEAERDIYRKQIDERKPVDKPELKAPTLEQSGYDEDAHQKALAAYQEAVIERKAEEAAAKLLEKRDAEARENEKRKTFTERMQKLSADERETAMTAPIASNEHAAVISESEFAPQVLLHLANNRELAERLGQLPVAAFAREIGRIEASFLQKPSAPAPVSKAPPPVVKFEASEPVVQKEWNDPSLSQSEFNKRRRQYIENRR